MVSFPPVFPPTPYTPPLLPHTHNMPSPSHSSRFYHPHNIGWGISHIITNSKGFKRRNILPQRLIYTQIIFIHASEVQRQFDSQSNCPRVGKSAFIPWNGGFLVSPRPSRLWVSSFLLFTQYRRFIRWRYRRRCVSQPYISHVPSCIQRSDVHFLVQWFPTWGSRTPRDTNQDI